MKKLYKREPYLTFTYKKYIKKDIQNWEKYHSIRKPAGIPKLLKPQYESSPEGVLMNSMLPAGKQLSWWNRSWYGLQSQQL